MKNEQEILEELDRKNKKGQTFINQLVIQGATNAPEALKEEAEITRMAAEIMKDIDIKNKVNELSEEISKKLDPTKLLGDSPHKDKVAYYAENAHKYIRDAKGNYVLREEYLVRAVAKQISAELVTKSKKDRNKEEKTEDNEIDEK